MSSPNPSDPRMLLPDWLRDNDAPDVPTQPSTAQTLSTAGTPPIEAAVEPSHQGAASAPVAPYSDRLSLDTRLDPGQLVTPADIPSWLGGLERAPALPVVASGSPSISATTTDGTASAIDAPEPYLGVDAPEEGVIDIEVNGWYAIAGAIVLLILLAAALRLYLS